MTNFDDAVQRRIEQLASLERVEEARRADEHNAQLQTAEDLSSRLSKLVGDRLFVSVQVAPSQIAADSLYVAEVRHRRTNLILGYAASTLVIDSAAEAQWYEVNPNDDPEELPLVTAYYFCGATIDDETGEIFCDPERIGEHSHDFVPHNLSIDLFLSHTVDQLVDITAKHERSTSNIGPRR